MTKKSYPCDGEEHICPYGDGGGMYFCRDHCGLGVDEDSVAAEELPDDEVVENDLNVISLLEIITMMVKDLEEHNCDNVESYIQQLARAGYKYERSKFEPPYDKNAKTNYEPCYMNKLENGRLAFYKCKMCGSSIVIRHDNISTKYPDDYALDCTCCGEWEEVGNDRPGSFESIEVIGDWRESYEMRKV